MSPLVSIIILNYNGKDFLEPCFESLKAQTFTDFEIILVDNGSSDGSVALIKERYPDIRVIENEENVGFAEGNNQGIRASTAEYIVTLNNDTTVDSKWLNSLVNAAKVHDEAGLFSSKILSMEPPHLIDSVGLNVCIDGMARGKGRLEPDEGQYDGQTDILVPSACAALYKKKMLDEAGLFDKSFFAYCEDIDLGLRCRIAGWGARFVPEAVVYHHYSGTGGKFSPLKAYLVERNHLFVVIKNYPFLCVMLAPLFTSYRFLLQFISILFKKGAASELKNNISSFELIGIIIKAYFSAFIKIPRLFTKRWRIQWNRKISKHDIYVLLTKHNLTFKELVFKK